MSELFEERRDFNNQGKENEAYRHVHEKRVKSPDKVDQAALATAGIAIGKPSSG